MSASRVLFKRDPELETEHTALGTAIGWRLSPEGRAAVRRQLEGGPHLAAFDAGMDLVRDIANPADFAWLVLVRDRELLDAIDRDQIMRSAARQAAIEREVDTRIVDVEDF